MPDSNFILNLDEERGKLNVFFKQRSCLSGYSRHVLDSILMNSQIGKQPAWYSALSTELVQLQAQAQAWFDTVAPPLTQLPQWYIDVANQYLGQFPQLSAAVENLINKNGSNVESDVDTIIAIFDRLLNVARAQSRAVGDGAASLRTYGGVLTQAIDAMTNGAESVNAAIVDEKAAIADTTNAIAALQGQLETDMRALIGAAVGAGIGLGAAVAGIVLAISETGVGAVVTAVVGVVVAIGGAIATALLAVSVVADQQAIFEKQNLLSEQGRQMVELNGLSLTVNGLLRAYQDKNFDLSPLQETWTTLASDLQSARDLIVAERTDPTLLRAVQQDLQDLATTFKALTAFATDIQNRALDGDAQPLTIYTIPRKSAA